MYNSSVSFNYFMKDIVDQISEDIGQKVHFFVEEGDFLEYPAVVVSYIDTDIDNPEMNMKMHLVELRTLVIKGDTATSLKLRSKLMSKMGLGKRNFKKRIQVEKKNYDVALSDGTTPVAYDKMFVDLIPGHGFKPQDDTDTDLRTNARPLFVIYNEDLE